LEEERGSYKKEAAAACINLFEILMEKFSGDHPSFENHCKYQSRSWLGFDALTVQTNKQTNKQTKISQLFSKQKPPNKKRKKERMKTKEEKLEDKNE